jgi:histidine phosphotransfer protein HptB
LTDLAWDQYFRQNINKLFTSFGYSYHVIAEYIRIIGVSGMHVPSEDIVNWTTFTETRGALGDAFVRVLGYFREDGTASVAAIEEAIRKGDSAAIVIPAHTLKGESAQFGAERLAALAEDIEFGARHYVELRQGPEELLEKVVQLRPLFEQSLKVLQSEISPLVERRSPFGARTFGSAQFGRGLG